MDSHVSSLGDTPLCFRVIVLLRDAFVIRNVGVFIYNCDDYFVMFVFVDGCCNPLVGIGCWILRHCQ